MTFAVQSAGFSGGMPVSESWKPSEAWTKALHTRVAKKAGFEDRGCGAFGKKSWRSLTSQHLGAGRAPAVLMKASKNAQHHVHAAALRCAFQRHQNSDNPSPSLSAFHADVLDDECVLDRVYRQDFIRFNQALFEKTEKTNGVNGKEVQLKKSRNWFAFKMTRAAHVGHGVCEVFSAPTGFSSNVVQNATTPNTDLKGMKSKWIMSAILLPLGICVSSFFDALKKSGALEDATIGPLDVGSLVAVDSAFSAMAAGAGTVAAMISQATLTHERLNTAQKQSLKKQQDVILQKLDTMLGDSAKGTQGYQMLGKALNRKIDSRFRDLETGEPLLLKNLKRIHSVYGGGDAMKARRLEALAQEIGRYLNEPITPARQRSNKIMQRLEDRKQKRDLSKKESHFVTLCDLIDHPEIDGPGTPLHIEDFRRTVERKVAQKQPKVVIKNFQALIRKIPGVEGRGFDRKLSARLEPDYKKNLAIREKKRWADGLDITSTRRILMYRHQYSSLTVGLMVASEAFRRISLDIILAKNAQLSRCWYNVCSRLSGAIKTGPVSHSVCFSLGRVFGGTTLSLVMIGLAKALLAGGIAATPLGSGFLLSILAAGTGMAACSVISLILGLCAKAAVLAGGYAGNAKQTLPSASENAHTWFAPSALKMA